MTIPGLTYIPEYLNQQQHDWLLAVIDKQVWSTELKRRVQHYGYKYDYRKRAIDQSMALPTPPNWIQRLAAKVHEEGHAPLLPDQIIINEYQPGQGIAAHVDCEPCFGDTIISLSLGSPCIMDFRHRKEKTHSQILLEPRSLLIMAGESRHDWTHGIAARQTDEHAGQIIQRQRRVSITLRTVILASDRAESTQGFCVYNKLTSTQRRLINVVKAYGCSPDANTRFSINAEEGAFPTWTVHVGKSDIWIFTVEDRGTHYRVRGNERRDDWKTVTKDLKLVESRKGRL